MIGKVSIIIPVYNTELYVENCIDSILKQTYKNLEIILINDGSNEICSNLLLKIKKANKNIKLITNNENKGVGAARNIGMENATGDYIYFLDSDDYIPKETIELLVSNIKSYPIIRGKMKTTHFDESFTIFFEKKQDIKYFEDNKYNLIKKSGVHNFLIRKDIIDDTNLRFDESVRVMTDLQFITTVVSKVTVIPYIKEAMYFRRKRNYPINAPSLEQLKMEDKIDDVLYVFNALKKQFKSNDPVNEFLDEIIMNFIRKDFEIYTLSNTFDVEKFNSVSQIAKLIHSESMKDLKRVFKLELSILQKGNSKSYLKFLKRKVFLKSLLLSVRSKRNLNIFIYEYIFQKLPKKNKWIFFESFQGRNYSDNPKYLYQYLNDNKEKYEYIWSVQHPNKHIPYKHKQVLRESLRYFYYLARSKYWVLNTRLPNYISKSKRNVYLQTWHGTPLKKLAGDMSEVHMPGTNTEKYKLNFFQETQKWDYLISPNNYSSQIFKRAFWFKGCMLNSGYPRNDILYTANNVKDIEGLKTKLGLPRDKKVLLYAPTWRDDEYYEKGKYKFQLEFDLKKMHEKFSDEYIIIFRMHYVVSTQLDISDYEGFAYDMSSYDDISELYLISDILITDYSSVFFDFANLKRPILYFVYDIDKYKNTLRGFYINMSNELPGPLLKSSEELLTSIENIEAINVEYLEKYKEFYNRFCAWDDGKASAKVVEEVFNKRKAHNILDLGDKH